MLPGFKPDSKLQMLLQLKEDAEIVIVINAADIEKNKVRGDLGITYDADVLRLYNVFTKIGLYVSSVVLTRYDNCRQPMRSRTALNSLASGYTTTMPSRAIPRTSR